MQDSDGDNDETRDDLAGRLYRAFIAGQPDVALRKINRFLEAASDLADYYADRVAASGPPGKHEPAAGGGGLLHTLQVIVTCALRDPDRLAEHYARFAGAVLDAVEQRSELEPDAADRRFKDRLWHEAPFFRALMQIYLAWTQHVQSWLDEQELAADDRRRAEFIVEQFAAAFSPSNLPLQPAALKRAEKSGGLSTVRGLRNLIDDIRFNAGMPRQIKSGIYELGRDLATTPGKVIFRNELLELIQYAPQARTVHRRPVLLIPPQINKFYAFDLKPVNSFVLHALQAGFQVFVVSWSNSPRMSPDWGLDHYVAALLDAVEAVRSVCASDSINVVSTCAGGFTTLALLGYLAETGRPLVRSHSLFVTAVLKDSDSILELLTTQEMLDLARRHTEREGTMDGKALAHLFAWLRPGDLVWNYWVNNNLMGRDPPPLDVIFWDNDPTRLPARLHADFLDMYERAVFERPHGHAVLGVPIDYGKVTVSTYFTAGRDDYLMPWSAVYRGARHFGGEHRFVLSDSGHVQSVLRHPKLARTLYYTNPALPADPGAWLRSAMRHDGSWWLDWYRWLAARSGEVGPAPAHVGNAAYPPTIDAPGEYVRERLQ